MTSDRLHPTANEWPEIFAAGWRASKPGGFIEYFRPLIHADAVFSQPLAPTATGLPAVEKMFALLFARFPDFMVTPQSSSVVGDVVTITSICTVTIGRRQLTLPVEDQLQLKDGLISRRVASFSASTIVTAILLSPRTWWRLARAKPQPSA